MINSMENNIIDPAKKEEEKTSATTVSSVPPQTEPGDKEKKPVQKKNSVKTILLIMAGLGIFLLSIQIFLILFSRSSRNTTAQITPSIIPANQPSIAPTLPPVTPTVVPSLISFYTISSSSLNTISTIHPANQISFQGQPPVMDQSGYIYYIDQSNVYQQSLANQTTKIIYTNTKQATKIASISFVAPSFLYISIIINPLDSNYNAISDKSASLIELNLATSGLRAIGPLKTITNGYTTYLLQSGVFDIVRVVEKNYCKGLGEIFSYASGSASLITNDGFGCNGVDPYFIGQIENSSKIVLVSPNPATRADDFPNRYAQIYTIDTSTSQQDYIFDLSSLYPQNRNIIVGPTSFALSQDKTLVYSVIGSKIYTIDMKAKALLKTVDLSNVISINNYSLITIANNSLFYINKTAKNLAIIDINTGNISIVPQNIITDPNSNNQLFFLGMWNNQPIFYATFSNNQ